MTRSNFEEQLFMETTNNSSRRKVVIIGGGFAGMYAAKALANRPVDVTLIDRTNHHLFQPLLYQVATAGLSPADVAQPIRHILRLAQNIRVVMGTVEGIDVNAHLVNTQTRQHSYDYLIIAAGARHSYFGNPDWEGLAPGLKSLSDAIELRRRILSAFEVAETTSDKELRKAALTFVIIGAGPTGVEMAGAIIELAERTLADDFREIRTTHAKVILLDAAPRVLPVFTEDLSASAQKQLEGMGVEVRVGKKVVSITPDGVQLEDEFIKTRTIVWAAGNEASSLGKLLGVPTDRPGRVLVGGDLTIPGHPEVFVIGDMAGAKSPDGKPLPGVAPAAMQMGTYAAKTVLARIAGIEVNPFKYLDKGNMATIGRNKAVADLHFVRFGGFPAWLAWLLIHLVFLVGFKNQIQVFFQWMWAYITFGRGSRLIYGRFRPVVEPKEPRVPSKDLAG
jgi:NADH:ubiquinone reductase (H+-translocating)